MGPDGVDDAIQELKAAQAMAKALSNTLAAALEALDDPGEAEPDAVILDVPYLSQWDVPDADDRPGDCGPACVAMLAHYLAGERPTVDDAADLAGQPTTGRGKWYTGFSDLIRSASAFRIELEVVRPLTLDMLEVEVDEGHPPIVLINYGTLGEDLDNQDGFIGAHWVLVIGYDDDNFYIHDPDFWGKRRNDGAKRTVPRSVLDRAMGTVSKTPGNSHNNQGLAVARVF